MSLLRSLDEKYVPRMAEALDRLWGKFPKAPEPTGPLPVILRLRRLDDRWTNAGPLAVLRDIPQLGAVLIGALVLANGATIRARLPERERLAQTPNATQSPGPFEIPDDGTLGPDLGDDVNTYIRDTKARLRSLAPGAPDSIVVAVVMFTAYRTPDDVASLVGTLQVRQVFYRADMPLPQGTPETVQVIDLVADTRKDMRRIAAVRTAEAKELRKVAATITNDAPQKREHEKDAAIYEHEARILRGRCPCVYAVAVRTRLRLLLDLLQSTSIRAIDVSNVDAKLEDFTFTALLPEEKTTVTGGNQE
jgi:hypothetical protein